MKDQYFGDVNDYRKYGLLRSLIAASGFRLGVCWLRTADVGGGNGERRRYLKEPRRWRRCDPPLYDALRELEEQGGKRSVLNAESRGLLPGAAYHNRFLTDSPTDRALYFADAWKLFGECELIFLDPDNGIEIPSVKRGHRHSSKYVYWSEIGRAFALGHSLVLYQHFPRVNREDLISRLAGELSTRLGVQRVDSFQTAHVVFFLVPQPHHVAAFRNAPAEIQKNWADQIEPKAHTFT